MSAPPATEPQASSPATVSSEQLPPAQTPASVSVRNVTPLGAGVAGGVLGFGAGLVVAELVVPGLVLGAIALVGLSAAGRLPRFMRWRRS